MARIALIGGSGFIGKNLMDTFIAAGHDVMVISRKSTGISSQHHIVPLEDIQKVLYLIEAHQSEVVIHLACGLLPSSTAELFINEQTTLLTPSYRLINYCAQHSIIFVLISSGGTIYGDTDQPLIREGHPRVPKNFYGLSKLMLEDYVLFSHRTQGLPYLIIRPSNPYGRYQALNGAQGIVAISLGRNLSGTPIEIWGDGSIVRDYVDVLDFSNAISTLIQKRIINKIFNIGSEIGHSITELLATVAKVTGGKCSITYHPARTVDVQSVILDTTALASVITWNPRPLEDGIKNFYASIKNINDH